MLGVHAGSLVHVAAATLGISALLAASATAFTVVKYAGIAYLVWLGARKLLRRGGGDEAVELPVHSRRRMFWEGFVVNVLNPKTAIFFLAFLPQFTDAAIGPIAPQMLLLGLLWVVLGMASDGTYAMLAATLAGRVRRSATARRRLDIGTGLVYLGLAAWLTRREGLTCRPSSWLTAETAWLRRRHFLGPSVVGLAAGERTISATKTYVRGTL